MAPSKPRTYPCEHVSLDFIDTAPIRFVSTVDLAITPEQLFEVLGDAQSWPKWASVITNVEWTSPEPRGVSTTRTVSMRGNIVGDEEFVAWEPFSHMAFRFNQSTTSGAIPTSGTGRSAPILLQHRPDHAERLTRSGSATVSSRADRMTRVRRSSAS